MEMNDWEKEFDKEFIEPYGMFPYPKIREQEIKAFIQNLLDEQHKQLRAEN